MRWWRSAESEMAEELWWHRMWRQPSITAMTTDEVMIMVWPGIGHYTLDFKILLQVVIGIQNGRKRGFWLITCKLIF